VGNGGVVMKIVILGGVPASGKSSAVKEVIRLLEKTEKPSAFLSNGVKGILFDKQRVLVLGDYEREQFPGTDALSMSVQPKVLSLLKEMQGERIAVCLEGDRLFNLSFIRAVGRMGILCEVVVVEASQEVLRRRRGERKTLHDAVWLKGRESKVRNIKNDPGVGVHIFMNDNQKQLALVVDAVLGFLMSDHKALSGKTILKFL
jgi:hypothetical protein